MLFLNQKDMVMLGRDVIQDAVKDAYGLFLGGDYTMPDRIHVQDRENTLLFMPCFSNKYVATKLVSVFPGAPQLGQPSVNGVLILSDNATGQPLAIMDGAALTAERTGAVGGLGVDLLTPGNIETAGIIGAGVQGMSQARYLFLNRKIKTLWVNALHPESAQKMVAALEPAFPGVTFVVSKSAGELVEACGLIIAATTATDPLFKDDPGLVRGKTFISIGSFRPEMREFPDAVSFNADFLYVDTPFAAKESGDILIPLKNSIIRSEKIKPFADLLQNPVAVKNKTCLFKSVGMALFDLAVSSAVYEGALEKKIGRQLDV